MCDSNVMFDPHKLTFHFQKVHGMDPHTYFDRFGGGVKVVTKFSKGTTLSDSSVRITKLPERLAPTTTSRLELPKSQAKKQRPRTRAKSCLEVPVMEDRPTRAQPYSVKNAQRLLSKIQRESNKKGRALTDSVINSPVGAIGAKMAKQRSMVQTQKLKKKTVEEEEERRRTRISITSDLQKSQGEVRPKRPCPLSRRTVTTSSGKDINRSEKRKCALADSEDDKRDSVKITADAAKCKICPKEKRSIFDDEEALTLHVSENHPDRLVEAFTISLGHWTCAGCGTEMLNQAATVKAHKQSCPKVEQGNDKSLSEARSPLVARRKRRRRTVISSESDYESDDEETRALEEFAAENSSESVKDAEDTSFKSSQCKYSCGFCPKAKKRKRRKKVFNDSMTLSVHVTKRHPEKKETFAIHDHKIISQRHWKCGICGERTFWQWSTVSAHLKKCPVMQEHQGPSANGIEAASVVIKTEVAEEEYAGPIIGHVFGADSEALKVDYAEVERHSKSTLSEVEPEIHVMAELLERQELDVSEVPYDAKVEIELQSERALSEVEPEIVVKEEFWQDITVGAVQEPVIQETFDVLSVTPTPSVILEGQEDWMSGCSDTKRMNADGKVEEVMGDNTLLDSEMNAVTEEAVTEDGRPWWDGCSYRCVDCPRVLSDRRRLLGHNREVHERFSELAWDNHDVVAETQWKCGFCGMSFLRDRISIAMHLEETHDMRFEEYDASKFSNAGKLKAVKRNDKNGGYAAVPEAVQKLCNENRKWPLSSKKRILALETEKVASVIRNWCRGCRYECTFCGAVFRDRVMLRRHAKLNHDSRKWNEYATTLEVATWQCIRCKKEVQRDVTDLKNHIRRCHNVTLDQFVKSNLLAVTH
jgi:PHD/YefM family antitoxin component YafN of YafNO toxin-antitoxin module